MLLEERANLGLEESDLVRVEGGLLHFARIDSIARQRILG
jgi:hypothetical protein